MVPEPVLDGRRAERVVQELHRYAPHYTPDLNLADAQGAGPALMRIFAHLAEHVLVQLGQTPRKHFVAFLDRLGINLLPARPATAAMTFRLASALKETVEVPVGTRVIAAGPDDDIPFETTGTLLAVPGTIAAAYGVDPLNDAIYPPPPGFLAQEIRTPTELVYEVRSFAEAGANRLQLDHVTEIKPGAFLLLGDTDRIVVKALAEGTIVILEAPLARDVQPGAIVTPIRDFEVFNGIDVQEHVLYLGHPELFSLKEQAEITIAIGLAASPTGALSPLAIAWQFWTKDEEGPPDSEEHWHDFVVTSDTTQGLSASGSVVLSKPPEPPKLEIKERTVDGRASRWIRAKLSEKLPATGRTLPEIDTITIAVKSVPKADLPAEQQGIAPDQGFHNSTPLDLKVDPEVGFLPFGAEPRQFDQFYLASKEAFSKPEAAVTLNIELDLQTLAAPSLAAVAAGNEVRAYAIGLRRNLYELNPGTGGWQLLGSPAAVVITERPQGSGFNPVEDSEPSALIDATDDDLYVFVNTDDSLAAENPPNRIWAFYAPGGVPGTTPWKDLGAPGPTPPHLRFGPTAVRLTAAWVSEYARVFAVPEDGKLYSLRVDDVGAPIGSWISHGTPTGIPLESPLFVTMAGDDVLVFVSGKGVVHRFTLHSNGTSEWLSLTAAPALTAFPTAVSRPFAVPVAGAEPNAKVFVFGTEDGAPNPKLFECDTRILSGGLFRWEDLGAPPAAGEFDTEPDAHAPTGFIEDPAALIADEGKHIFIRGADGHLYERLDGTDEWEDRTRTGDSALRGSPAARALSPVAGTTVLHVLSASTRNSLITWEFESRTGAVPAAADGLAVRLDEKASDADDFYTGRDFAITAGPGSPEAANTVLGYDGVLRIASLTNALGALPDSTSTCDIDGDNVEIAGTDEDNLVALHDRVADFRRADLLQLRIDGDVTDTDVYSRLTGVVRLDNPLPGGAANYSLYSAVINVTNAYAPLEDRSSVPELSWEFWNGSGWLSLPLGTDTTRNFLSSGQIKFTVPAAIEETEVAGQSNFWVRARLVGGDYGRETFKVLNNTTVVAERSTLRPPRVRQLLITYEGPPLPAAACLTFNNLDYLDQTAAGLTSDAHFRPFEPLEKFPDRSISLMLGFDHPFSAGPVRVLIDAAEREFDETRPPELDWRFRKDRLWKPVDADDGSTALTRHGILTLSASEELTLESRFGKPLFWIAGSLRTDRGVSGAEYPMPLLRGIVLNTVWARQGETITGEIIGSSDGEPNQFFKFQHDNVLDGEDIRVREVLSVEEREQIVREGGRDRIVDREDLGGTWVRWQETLALFDAGPEDRVYVMDRAAGEVRFGDGVHGRIPPADVDSIRAFSYRTGGGTIGNLPPGKIDGLATAVAGIESVFNPTAADGGSDKATTEAMLTIGPRRISHRDRAVSPEDFEELAQEASRQVAKVRCLATTNLARRGAGAPDPCDQTQRHDARPSPGWVSLILVPESADPRPCPSLALRRTVKEFLRARVPGVLTSGDRIVIRPPDYVEVAIEADIFVTSLEFASRAETAARKRLEQLLHPLRGGADGRGWEFGRSIGKSDVFAALERIDEIDRVENLRFRFRGLSDPDHVVIGPNELLASGEHKLAVKKA